MRVETRLETDRNSWGYPSDPWTQARCTHAFGLSEHRASLIFSVRYSREVCGGSIEVGELVAPAFLFDVDMGFAASVARPSLLVGGWYAGRARDRSGPGTPG